MAKSTSMYKKPTGRKVGTYFKGKTESPNRGADKMGRRFKSK